MSFRKGGGLDGSAVIRERIEASNVYLAAYAAMVRAEVDLAAARVRAIAAGLTDDDLAKARALIDLAAGR